MVIATVHGFGLKAAGCKYTNRLGVVPVMRVCQSHFKGF